MAFNYLHREEKGTDSPSRRPGTAASAAGRIAELHCAGRDRRIWEGRQPARAHALVGFQKSA
jgi:hypothetical protein